MPSISIDLPMSHHGYEVRAEEVFWVNEGILRSTDLRDSLDEQCIADIIACIVGGQLIERSKDALDEIYVKDAPESELTPELRDAVLSNMDFNSFYGLGVIAITVPSQAALSYVGEDLYWRNGDSTELAKTAKEIAGLASRFAKG